MILELNQNDFFYELCENDEVLVYEEEDKFYKRFCSCLSDSVVKICVKNMETLKNRLLYDLNVFDLPFAIYYSNVITKHHKIQKEVNRIDLIKYDLLERKVNKIIYLNNVAIFLEGRPGETDEETTKIIEQFESIPYVYYNVLLNNRLRNYVTDMTKCNTFPQIYINGNYIKNHKKIPQLLSQIK
ncbi:hypothetical protein NAPIS_ORF02578 [Vairimorpha apis BRL 01]|uniref:Glutaredoxin domain-containing protein n=1 Tax=Vairimorpha apis BRL 01 TaxID=1037528 RepID=T0M8W6_9MICR|nr:hypothetical protein NAPIS_ORF02578 [Vairimorpha apis BRL 01]